LHTLFSNIVLHADDPKYRKVGTGPCLPHWQGSKQYDTAQEQLDHLVTILLQVKAANKAYQKHVASVHHTDELMLQAGWRPKVPLMSPAQQPKVLNCCPVSTDCDGAYAGSGHGEILGF
jgi:hypothetical protein